MLSPDLIRGVLSVPLPTGWDRGRALEEAWLRLDIPWSNRERAPRTSLTGWEEGREEAVLQVGRIFNSTVRSRSNCYPLQ